MIDKLADAAAQSGAVGLLEADLGSGSSETFVTPAVSVATGGDLNPASILVQATATGGDVTGGSASLAGTTVQMGVAGGLVFNITYDSSVSSAPAGFTSAIADVVNYYESVFSDPIAVNIDVGWGEVAGQSLGGALGASETNLGIFSYSQVNVALAADAKSADDATAVASLPGSDPTDGGSFVLATAEAKALGLGAGAAVDGYIGFSSSVNYTFDPSNPAVSGTYDFIGVAEHEISEVMGRIALLGTPLGGLSHTYTALDLFRYSSPGVRQFAAGNTAYFSLDGGNTGLNNFNTLSGGDAGDWASGGANDAYNAFAGSGVALLVTPNDLRVMDAIGWDSGTSRIDTPPVVTVSNSNITANPGQVFAASSLFTASDPDGDAITQYDFWDTGGGGGQFLVNGAAQPANGDIYVTAAQLAQTTYQSGNGTDTLWVRANDGTQWSAWSQSIAVTTAGVNTATTPEQGDMPVSLLTAQAAPIILTVGPSGQYRTIIAAVDFANADTNPNDNFDIRVAPGTYTNDFSEVTRPMTIEVDPNATGAVVLLATELIPNQKGIIIADSSLTVRGLTFEGAAVSNADGGNGAGIRDQNYDGETSPASLIVENCTFTGNQEGILTGYDASETIQIINSTFENNGNPNANYFQHALYVNNAGSLTVTGSVFGGQLIGHDIKSRAMTTIITNNRIYDGAADPADGIGAGSTSYGIDTPNGGVVTILGNLIVQGPASPNHAMVAYGEEGLIYGSNSLSVSNNTFISTGLSQATGIYDPPSIPVQLSNNTFQGVATPVYPPSAATTPSTDTPPVVTPTNSNIAASPGQVFPASSLFTANDPDGDAITQYDFWDAGGGGGRFLVNGVAQPTNGDIYVTATQLAQTTYQSGNGMDTLWVRANDGTQWSTWSPSFTVTAQTVDTPPVVTPTNSNITASAGQIFAASSLFNASDPDGDAITQYDFWDAGGGGHFLVNGVVQPANSDVYVTAEQLAQTTYQSGNGMDTLWVRANDGTQWSAWSPSFAVTGQAEYTLLAAGNGGAQATLLAHSY